MKIGLLITLFDRPKYLQKTLDSIKNSYLPDELTIVLLDDCSTDKNTLNIFNNFKLENVPIVRLKNKKNRGIAYNIKKGFDYLYENDFDILVNLDPDALVKPYWFNLLLDLFSYFPHSLITGFNTPAHESTGIFESYHTKKSVGGINLMFNRNLWTKLRPKVNNSQWDWDISKKLASDNISMIASSPSVITHIGENSSMGHGSVDTSDMWVDVNYFNGFKTDINSYFQHIFCINLDRRKDRWEKCQKEFKKHKIYDVERVSAVDGRDIKKDTSDKHKAIMGCSLSHVKVLEEMVKQKWNSILVLEDDVEFADNFSESFYKSIGSIPEFDMLYFGGSDRKPPIKVNNIISKVTCTATTSSYAITLPFAKKIIPEIKKLSKPVDDLYIDFQKKIRCYIYKPHLIKQRIDYSDIEMRQINYSGMM
jgi:GR25 family glycosyltransferase involved in LPS biosynthesis